MTTPRLAFYATAPSAQGGSTASAATVPFLIVLLMTTGIVADLQAVGMAPLVGVIAKDLPLGSTELTWILNALLIGGAVGVGLTSRLGDIHGHKRMLLTLSLCGLIGSVMVATAFDAVFIALGRFLQGFAVATPLGWGLLRPWATKVQIQLGASLLSLVICIFTPVSLVLGGVFLRFGFGWQGVFWILSILYAIMAVLTVISSETPASARANVPIDLVGAIGLGVWLVALLLGISLANKYGFLQSTPMLLFSLAAICFGAWVFQQRKRSQPLMDFSDVDIKQMLGGYCGLVGTAVVAAGLYIILPLMLMAKPETGHGFGLGVLEASLPLLCILPGAYIVPLSLRRVMPRYGSLPCMIVSGLICSASFVGFAFFMQQLWLAYLWVTVYGIGVCGCYTIGWALVASSARPDNTGIVMASMTAVQKVAGSITIAIVIIALNPTFGPASTAVYSACFLGIALFCFVAYVVLPLFLVPSRLRDRHAADAA